MTAQPEGPTAPRTGLTETSTSPKARVAQAATPTVVPVAGEAPPLRSTETPSATSSLAEAEDTVGLGATRPISRVTFT